MSRLPETPIPGGEIIETRADLQMIQGCALWPIRPSLQQLVVDRLEEIIEHPSADPRHLIAASKVLGSLYKLNLEAVPKEHFHQHQHEHSLTFEHKKERLEQRVLAWMAQGEGEPVGSPAPGDP